MRRRPVDRKAALCSLKSFIEDDFSGHQAVVNHAQCQHNGFVTDQPFEDTLINTGLYRGESIASKYQRCFRGV